MTAATVQPRAATGRWAVLGAYALLAACTQLLWLTFAPVTIETARALRVDVGVAGDLAAVFPLVYVGLALPAGRWLDGRFARALGAGAVLTGAGALLRVAVPTSFAWQLAAQLVIAAGQPLVLNAITKVAAGHFPLRERPTAIAIGTVALYAGILAAVLAGGPLFAAGGLGLLLTVEAAPAVVAAAAVLVALRVPPAHFADPPAAPSLRWLLRDRFLWTLAGLVFVGMGVYNAVATWLEPILHRFTPDAPAGALVALMTFAGVLGAALLPSLVAARDRRRALLLAALGTTTVVFAALMARHDVAWTAAWLAVLGFLLMASLPVVLDWAEVHVGPERQGAAAGLLLLAGNLGGLVLVLVVQALLGNVLLALAALAASGLLAFPLALRLPARTR